MAGGSRIEVLEGQIQQAYARLAESAAVARYCHEHYLDDLSRGGAGDGDPFAAVTGLAAAHPWALGGFGDPDWDRYQPDLGAAPPDGVRAGLLTAGPGGGLPPMPAVARLAGHGHILITEDEAPEVARLLLQAMALRLAVATRPLSVRFALADPEGQGQHLSAFLRLPAPLLRVGSGVAVSEAEIEALLKTLTEHVVEVTQHRLTNVYSSVEEYNEATTGAAVPYHLLVLAGFPAHFTDRTARLLAGLAANGPRAGVYILATVAAGQEMPRGFDLESLTGRATNLWVTAAGTVTWDDPDFPGAVIGPDQMPPAERANPWLDAVADAALSGSQNLSFARIAVPPEQRWRGDSTDGLRVQIGVDSRGEPQYFVMGSGGVQHGLVGGTTGYGKSNLLHVLITQLTLRYPPEELELYLLDFKEVEFDAYLTERLPHGQAIAARTDREFGLSMLRQFHDEIEQRARLCRASGTTKLSEHRRATGEVVPRALVIMDEFQVLFADDDRIARDAARLLAGIAQRGRSFGLHLLLATQSPGDVLTTVQLRPVYDQMALRVALYCVPRVSQAILGLGNEAAATLTEPGYAIYNAQGGAGANPVIRIAMLETPERRDWLTQIRALAGDREYLPPKTFDPGADANFTTHPVVAKFAARPGHWPAPEPTAEPAVEAWLGEAVEIKPPTAAAFHRYIRGNLLIVGEEADGHALLLAALLSAAVQRSPADVSFTIAEFTPPFSSFHHFFAPLTGLPHDVAIHGPQSAEAALDTLIADLDARLASQDGPPAPSRFFLVAGLQWWQELSVDVKYNQPGEAASKLARLAKDGPSTGIHVVAWTDSYSAAAAASVPRRDISTYGLRAVLRVSDTSESVALLGVPGAYSLDDNRALFRDSFWKNEKTEKFKPYSLNSLKDFARFMCESIGGQVTADDACWDT